ncbi:MAG: aspartate-semialdehyde dehydrogenase [Flavobacteriales bacterium]|nr:aspartate-semialdehyde dehydrogenase [Flavobacteriales bacterium]
MKLAIVGCTGLVGNEVLNVLSELSVPIKELILVASKKNIGKKVTFKTKKIKIVGIQEAIDQVPEIAIFCAGSKVSEKWAQKFVDSGTSVIDNSSFFRMEENIPLIVPEVNGDVLKKSNKIIANPNCSTIQMVVALNDIYKKFGLKRLVISTYQSVSGTGQAAVKQMMDERQGLQPERVYPYQIDQNCFPHGGDFLENGYTTEELKLINETRKIFNDSSIKITATVVRIPVVGGHSESINVETHKPFQIEEIKNTLSDTAGVKVQDNPSKFDYPMPITAHKKNDVFVGRIRKDETVENGLNIWIVADNLRKGAATNAVQIADYISKNNLL